MAKAAVAVLIAGCLLAMVELSKSQLCSQCECLPEPVKRPICARQVRSGKYRGFRSICELDCSNRCRNDKFVFVAHMRCGKYLATLSSTTSTSTETPVPTSAPEVGAGSWVDKTVAEAGGSIFSSLMQMMFAAANGN